MTIGGDGAQYLAIGLEQGPVEVVAHVLLCHGEMSFIDQSAAVLGTDRDGLLCIDLIDDRKLRRRQAREREATATAPQHHPFSLARGGDLALLRQRADDIEKLAA